MSKSSEAMAPQKYAQAPHASLESVASERGTPRRSRCATWQCVNEDRRQQVLGSAGTWPLPT